MLYLAVNKHALNERLFFGSMLIIINIYGYSLNLSCDELNYSTTLLGREQI